MAFVVCPFEREAIMLVQEAQPIADAAQIVFGYYVTSGAMQKQSERPVPNIPAGLAGGYAASAIGFALAMLLDPANTEPPIVALRKKIPR